MLRSILAIVAGYAVMAVIVMAGFAIAMVAPEYVFEGNSSLEVTNVWLIWALAISLIAASAGGRVCSNIAHQWWPVLALASAVAALGLASAISNERKATSGHTSEQIAAMSVLNRAAIAQQPDWYAYTLPVLGVAGVLLGGRRK